MVYQKDGGIRSFEGINTSIIFGGYDLTISDYDQDNYLIIGYEHIIDIKEIIDNDPK